MKQHIIAIASALLLAVAVTELSRRIWPGSGLALLLLAFVALLVNGLFNARQAAAAAQQSDRRGSRPPRARTERASRDERASRGERSSQSERANKRQQTDGRSNKRGDRAPGGNSNHRGDQRGDRDNRTPSKPEAAPAATAASASSATADAAKPTPAATPVADGPREEGTVKWFNRSKGFGFVVRPNGDEIFVHQRSIRSTEGQGRPVLKDGEQVSFVVAERERGMQAEDVVPVRAG
ncbi:MAG: cold shock domain-containing protein [Pseudomonadales bacterium]